MKKKEKWILRLITLTLLLCGFIVTIGWVGHTKWSELNSDLKENHEKRLVPINELASLKLAYLREVVRPTKLFVKDEISYDIYEQHIDNSIAKIEKTWRAYKRSESNSYLKKEIHQTDSILQAVNHSILKQKNDFSKIDVGEKKWMINSALDVQIENLIFRINKIQSFYFNYLENAYVLSQNEFNATKFEFELIIALVIGVSLLLSFFVIRDINLLIKKLKQSRQDAITFDFKFKNFIQNAGDPIIILDESLEIIEVNNATEALFGYSREEILGNRTRNFMVDFCEASGQQYMEQIRKYKNGIAERKIRRKTGEVINVELNTTEQPGEGFLVIVRDITERKKAELALKESDEKYRYLFKNSPAYIIIWDLETFRIKEVNQAVLDRYGYTEEEWKFMDVFRYRPKSDHDRIRSFAQEMLHSSESISKGSWVHLTKSGEEIIMEITLHKIIYEGRVSVLSLARDVTDQRKASIELSEKKEQLRLFIDHSPVAMVMLDTEFRYLEVSRKWISDYGLYGQDIIGKSHFEVFPEIPKRWIESDRRALSGQIEKTEEDFFIRKNGKKEWIKREVYPWYKATGEIGGIVLMTEILTEKKKSQEMYQYLFENSPDVILIVNPSMRIELINRSVLEGQTVDDIIGQDSIEILPPEVREVNRKAIEECFKTGETIEVEHILTSDRYVRSRYVAMISNEEVTQVLVFATDITALWKTNLEVKNNEKRLNKLTEQISDGIVLLNE